MPMLGNDVDFMSRLGSPGNGVVITGGASGTSMSKATLRATTEMRWDPPHLASGNQIRSLMAALPCAANHAVEHGDPPLVCLDHVRTALAL